MLVLSHSTPCLSMPPGTPSGSRPCSPASPALAALGSYMQDAGAPKSGLPTPSSSGAQRATSSGKREQFGSRPWSPAQLYQRPFDVAYRDVAHQRTLHRIEVLFRQADADNSGCMDLDEFRKALKHPQMRQSFAEVGIQAHQADVVFMFFDVDRDGLLTLQEFMSGLRAVLASYPDGKNGNLDIRLLHPQHLGKLMEDPFRTWQDKDKNRPATAPAAIGRTGSEGAKHSAFLVRARSQALMPAHAVRGAHRQLPDGTYGSTLRRLAV